MQLSLDELAIGYLAIGTLVIGLPIIFFVVTFAPGLMRTTGEGIGTHVNAASEAKPEPDVRDGGSNLAWPIRPRSPRVPQHPHRKRTFETTP